MNPKQKALNSAKTVTPKIKPTLTLTPKPKPQLILTKKTNSNFNPRGIFA